MADISNSEDILDVREIIARVEELRSKRDDEFETEDGKREVEGLDDGEPEELKTLEALLDEMKGYGGDEQWEGDWYPLTLIRDSYFTDYAQELAEDIGAVSKDAGWPNGFIDWEKAAEALQIDYSTVEFDGVTYWYR